MIDDIRMISESNIRNISWRLILIEVQGRYLIFLVRELFDGIPEIKGFPLFVFEIV